MPSENSVTPLPNVFLSGNEKTINKEYIDIIIEEEIPILCVNKDSQKERLMPFKVLFDNNENFWQQDGNWEYFLTEENVKKLKDKAVAKHISKNFDIPPAGLSFHVTGTEKKLQDAEAGFGNDYARYTGMSGSEKVECLNNNKKRLSDLITQKHKDKPEIAMALVDSTKDAAMINHAVLEEAINMADNEAKKLTQDIVDSTSEIVKSSAQLIAENIFNNEMINTLVEKSNGTIVQHMTRVFLNGIAFLTFYNNLVSTSSAIQKLRVTFASKYRKYYHQLLPHINIDDIGLERVFYGGMRAIAPDLYFKWAVGFLIHDIGKAAAVEYHEGELSYDRNIVIDHVKQGYKSIMTKTNYPIEASLITGYHHEYYGNSDGYGYFRAYLQHYKKLKPDAKVDYCITYDLQPILDYIALSFFPAKMLEIIDIFDSVTDPHRVYRKAMSPEDALTMMREKFIEEHFKIDAVLFDIFSMFIREQETMKKK